MDYISEKRNIFSQAAELLLQMFFPLSTYCLCCGKPVDSTRSYSICDHCIRHITWGNICIDLEAESRYLGRQARLDSAVACVRYGLYERRLIFDLKYDGRTYVTRALGHIMADRLAAGNMGDTGACTRPGVSAGPNLYSGGRPPGHYGGFDYIVPVPVHRDKEKARGFNQAEKMARHLSRRIGVPVLPRAIIRSRNTAAQRSLSAEDRYFNLEGAFSINDRERSRIAGSRILLLDDVYTTGATAHQCGGVLKDAGAARVDFIAFATGNDFASGFFAVRD